MIHYKPVSITKASFTFCRFSIAGLVWISFFTKSWIILGLVCLLFLFSVILRVKRAPMILLYEVLFNRNHTRQEIWVDENSIFFAHVVGLIMSSACLALVLCVSSSAIWYSVLGFSVLKTVSAFGFCPASSLYDCTLNGNCCVKRK